jgi:hypothetical protein
MGIYLLWRVWLLVVSFFVAKLERPLQVTGYSSFIEFASIVPNWIAAWANFDGGVFLRIANSGYHVVELPFFPLLPMTMSILGHATGWSMTTVGLLIPLFVMPLGIWFAGKLWQMDTKDGIPFYWFVLVLLSFPTAHYFSALYQDSLFFTLATGTVFFARKRNWVGAVFMASLATLARLNGLALLVFLAAEYWMVAVPRFERSWGVRSMWRYLPKALEWRNWFGKYAFVWLFLFIPLTFVGYLVWIDVRFGDWHRFFSEVEVWHRNRVILPPQTLWRYVKILVLTLSVSLVYFVAVLEAAATALYSLVLGATWGKMRLSYWWWMLAHITIPVITGTLQGMPRYGLHLYPLFLILAVWTSKLPVWARVVYLVFGLGLQAWLAMWFLRGYFVA